MFIPNKKISVAIVILTYNQVNLTLSCLSYLNKLEKDNFNISIIVVDNGSEDGTVDIILKKYPKVILIDNKINYGFAKGINFGLKFAYQQGADYILFLNNDTIFPKNFLVKLVTIALNNSYFICGPKILTVDKKIWSLGGLIDKVRFSGSLIGYGQKNNFGNKNKEVDFIPGTAMLVQRKVFEKIGFLDEDYFLYYEDVDFCFRARNAGFSSYIVPQLEMIHLETLTTGKNSPLHYYHAAKSHLIFVLKRAPLIIKIREFFRIFKTIFELIKETNKIRKKYELLAIRDFFLLRFRTSILI